MATRTVKARVEIDGEKEYKAALSEMNNGNRVLASEMRKLQAQYKGNEDSTEALTAKGELLERQLLQQKDKVAQLRAAMENAARQTGESSAATQAWAVKLNDAEAAQFNLEHAIEENNKALENSQGQLKNENTSLVSVGNTVDDLAGKFGVRLPDGLKKSLDSFQGFSSGTVLAMSAAAASVAAVIKVVGELHEMTKKTAADVDEILTESMVTGLSTKTIQELKYAENLIDVSYSTITATLTKLTQSMDKARDGNEATAASFAALGVSITDETGQLRDAESVFYDVIDALGQIENPTERDAAAMELLGKSAQDLNPLIAQGSKALKDYAAQAQATGYVLDESQLKKLGEVDDAYQELQLQIEAVKKQMAAEFAPTSKEVMTNFADLVKKGGEALARSGILSGLGDIVKTSMELIKTIGDLINIFVPLDESLSLVKDALYGVAYLIAVIADAADLVKSVLTLDWNGFKNSMGFGYSSGNASHLQRVMMSQSGDLTSYDEYYRAKNSGGAANYGSNGASNNSMQFSEGAYEPEFYADYLNDVWRLHGTHEVYDYKYNGKSYSPSEFDELARINGWNASGNQNWRGGLTYVGENGPEAVELPQGTRIFNAQDTRALGGDTFYITIDAKNVREFNDIIEIAQTARVRGRMK